MMSIKATWLRRLDQMLDELRSNEESELDRKQFEQVFGLCRRESLRLMKRIGPKVERGRWVVDRQQLITWLERKQVDAENERLRRDKLTRGLMQADRLLPRPAGPFLSIQATQEMRQAARELPAGVTLVPGELRVQFTSLAQLAELLLQTGLALDRNFTHYADQLEPDAEGLRQRELERQDSEFFRNWRPEP